MSGQAPTNSTGVTMGILRGQEMLLVELRGPLGAITFPSVEFVGA